MRTIPDFTNPDWHRARADDQLLRSIGDGKGFMPAMKGKLEPTTMIRMVTLVREFQGGRQVVPEEPTDREDADIMTESRTSATPSLPRDSMPVPSVKGESLGPQLSAGRSLFQSVCTSCHGGDGRGSTIRSRVPSLPDFTSADWQRSRDDAQLSVSILDGKGIAMPSFVGKLEEAQVHDVVAYLRSFAPMGSRSNPRSSTEFARRFQKLQNDMRELDRQYRSASAR